MSATGSRSNICFKPSLDSESRYSRRTAFVLDTYKHEETAQETLAALFRGTRIGTVLGDVAILAAIVTSPVSGRLCAVRRNVAHLATVEATAVLRSCLINHIARVAFQTWVGAVTRQVAFLSTVVTSRGPTRRTRTITAAGRSSRRRFVSSTFRVRLSFFLHLRHFDCSLLSSAPQSTTPKFQILAWVQIGNVRKYRRDCINNVDNNIFPRRKS